MSEECEKKYTYRIHFVDGSCLDIQRQESLFEFSQDLWHRKKRDADFFISSDYLINTTNILFIEKLGETNEKNHHPEIPRLGS